MAYYLRVEAVNLSYFIDDTNDLSTTRGGGLLLLEAMEEVECVIEKNSQGNSYLNEEKIAQLKEDLKTLRRSRQTKVTKRKINRIESEIKNAKEDDLTPTITKGASWGLFNLNLPHEQASTIKSEVIKSFNTNPHYKHATIVVDLLENTGPTNYQTDRDSLQTLNHWQQMQAPSLAICKQGIQSCAIDKVRPACKKRDLKDKYKEDDYISESVNQRRNYGRKQKKMFYQYIANKVAEKTKEETDLQLVKELSKKTFTLDLTALSQSPEHGILHGKVAYIYIDGNGFGKIQKCSKTASKQRSFDQNSRLGREALLTHILKQIISDSNWQTEQEKEIRLETLLWGGDEIIWVVPAWQGWWMINEFYKLAEQYIQHDNNPLYHASGLVFCHHNAPIHRINALARKLADYGKEASREENYIAYQVLESFDHTGTRLTEYRKEQINQLGKLEYLLIKAEDIKEIQTIINQLKKDPDFSKRKIYQILQAYKEAEIDSETDHPDSKKAEHYFAKLSNENQDRIKALQKLTGNNQVHWLHLMDIWNYSFEA